MSDIAKCPWCGSSAHEQEWTTINGPSECVEVQCDKCERSVRGIDAIASWNALCEVVEAARKLMEWTFPKEGLSQFFGPMDENLRDNIAKLDALRGGQE